MNTNTEAQPQSAQDLATGPGQSDAAVDAITDAVLSGASPAEIQRLEAAAEDASGQSAAAGAEAAHEEAQQAQGVPQTLTQEASQANSQEGTRPGGQEGQAQALPSSQLVEELSYELAGVQAKLDEAAQNESLLTPNLLALQRKERELEREIASAEIEAGREVAARQQAATEARDRCMQTALQLYPGLTVRDTPLWREANRIATDPTHPDYNPAILDSPNAPLLIAKVAAANMGTRARSGGYPASAANPQGGAVRPASGAKSSAPMPPKLSPREVLQASEAATLAAIENGGHATSGQPDRAYMLV